MVSTHNICFICSFSALCSRDKNRERMNLVSVGISGRTKNSDGTNCTLNVSKLRKKHALKRDSLLFSGKMKHSVVCGRCTVEWVQNSNATLLSYSYTCACSLHVLYSGACIRIKTLSIIRCFACENFNRSAAFYLRLVYVNIYLWHMIAMPHRQRGRSISAKRVAHPSLRSLRALCGCVCLSLGSGKYLYGGKRKTRSPMRAH